MRPRPKKLGQNSSGPGLHFYGQSPRRIHLSPDTHASPNVLSSARLANQVFSGRKLWLTKTNAGTRRAHVRRSRTANTAVRPAKEPATRSNSTVIARTKSVREISELPEGIATKRRKRRKEGFEFCLNSF